MAPEGTFLYPHPLTLARNRAEAERIRLADTQAYAEMCATWGRVGGMTTLDRYGRGHYSLLARCRWGDPAARLELASRMDRRRGR